MTATILSAVRMDDLPLPVRLRVMRAAFDGRKSMRQGAAAQWISDNQPTVKQWWREWAAS